MGSFYHRLKANKTGERARNWVFFDCEAKIHGKDNEDQTHTLRLGCGKYRRFPYGDHKNRVTDFDFYTPNDFWSMVLGLCESDRRLYLVGYNVGYDIRLVRGFQVLHENGYRQTRIYVGGKVAIIEWVKAKHRIIAIDACNFFDGKLETWGTMLGLPKGEVDFRKVSERTLLKYCRRDVDILYTLMLRWFAFIDEHDLGSFRVTRASQSFAAFRHRFMFQPIYIHSCPRATAVERKAYHGGRTECFHIGKLTSGPYYKLDVNQMYPYIMRSLPVPVKLKSTAVGLSVPAIRRLIKKYALCGEFVIKTDDPVYPYKRDSDVFYPVGKFSVHLTTPEIQHALKHKHIKKVRKVCIYDKAVVFKEYVEYLHPLRVHYKKTGNAVFAEMVKYFMLSLYGKFGQRSEAWKHVDNELSDPDGEYWLIDDDTKRMIRYVVIAGERWNIQGKRESYHSFPAISAHITAAARLYLWSLICKAGRNQVFYCDTDSVITTAKGMKRLCSTMDNTALGMLKVEYATQRLVIYSPKEYKTDTETKHKGVKQDAVEVQPRVYRQLQWQNLRGSFLAGTSDVVRLKPVVKNLNSEYRKGTIHSSGSVSPLVLDSA